MPVLTHLIFMRRQIAQDKPYARVAYVSLLADPFMVALSWMDLKGGRSSEAVLCDDPCDILESDSPLATYDQGRSILKYKMAGS